MKDYACKLWLARRYTMPGPALFVLMLAFWYLTLLCIPE